MIYFGYRFTVRLTQTYLSSLLPVSRLDQIRCSLIDTGHAKNSGQYTKQFALLWTILPLPYLIFGSKRGKGDNVSGMPTYQTPRSRVLLEKLISHSASPMAFYSPLRTYAFLNGLLDPIDIW
jgi:hypothetical protein